MCGRFTQAYTWRELVALYGLTQPAMNLQPRYNIAPTTNIDVLIPRGADRLELWPIKQKRTPLTEATRRNFHVCLSFSRNARRIVRHCV
jgi:putative SOS response-associated peptidase YedK